ncbi:flagellar biosynthesis anti-sigma factor FlgM [Paenibacillus albiflavus]|uniref:Negative regulator of flagellin synthesis n=1 Tax=Paenibacillus albiflavus TaxID=2545760 RepID=A0A4R4EB13_9BACL|nr:flagellar biosynthesis anti-sigma factor FlgM [Paenibacillus albiflavus]TCZ76839.1 flagellar biosynthesis anti-sigma factor FlgM [Paenibacillus albiflavus]
MKINDIQRLGAINQYRRSGEGSYGKDASKNAKRRDQVEISSEAKELQELQGLQGASNRLRIEELKESVNAGTYHVDARLLADKLFPFVK